MDRKLQRNHYMERSGSFYASQESFQRKVSWNQESRKVHKGLASNIEEDQEGVDPNKAEKGIDLRNRSLLLEIIEHRIFR